MNGIIQRLESRAQISGKMLGLLSGVSLLAVSAVPAQAEDNALRIISLNTWGASTLIPESADLLSSGNYDFITIQEYRKSYGVDIQEKMADRGVAGYALHSKGDTGLAWHDQDILDFSNTDEPVHVVVGGANGRPDTIIATEHLDYREDPFLHRNREAHELNDWAAGKASPVIMTGDFNAGDVAERGLLEVVQQEFLMKKARERPAMTTTRPGRCNMSRAITRSARRNMQPPKPISTANPIPRRTAFSPMRPIPWRAIRPTR